MSLLKHFYGMESISDFVDADKLSSHYEIKDGVLLEYIGHDKELIIPEGVTEIGYNVFWDVREFDTQICVANCVTPSEKLCSKKRKKH